MALARQEYLGSLLCADFDSSASLRGIQQPHFEVAAFEIQVTLDHILKNSVARFGFFSFVYIRGREDVAALEVEWMSLHRQLLDLVLGQVFEELTWGLKKQKTLISNKHELAHDSRPQQRLNYLHAASSQDLDPLVGILECQLQKLRGLWQLQQFFPFISIDRLHDCLTGCVIIVADLS